MVFEDPPAPAARLELGFDTCAVPAARRLRIRSAPQVHVARLNCPRTELAHREALRRQKRRLGSARGWALSQTVESAVSLCARDKEDMHTMVC